ncbi:MAG: hypothetical protein M1114_06900 [Candidatus Dependentiae bacterium]|nr:hypothetical protein [Candidatus Dependentiae bacterium]
MISIESVFNLFSLLMNNLDDLKQCSELLFELKKDIESLRRADHYRPRSFDYDKIMKIKDIFGKVASLSF